MLIKTLQSHLATLRRTKPLILCLTNYVTMDLMANSLLALGAAPVMSVEKDETKELLQICQALYVNIGTLDKTFIQRTHFALQIAHDLKKPIILDPVGAGASNIRTQTALEYAPFASIIRGNASEMMALNQQSIKTAGVESTQTTQDAKQSALALAKTYNSTIVVSGKEDYITNGILEESQHFGSALMPLITGMGCTLTAVIAAFRAIIPEPFEAARMAVAYFGLCGSLAQQSSAFPGTFRSVFLDELFKADFKAMQPLEDRRCTNA